MNNDNCTVAIFTAVRLKPSVTLACRHSACLEGIRSGGTLVIVLNLGVGGGFTQWPIYLPGKASPILTEEEAGRSPDSVCMPLTHNESGNLLKTPTSAWLRCAL